MHAICFDKFLRHLHKIKNLFHMRVSNLSLLRRFEELHAVVNLIHLGNNFSTIFVRSA